MNKRTLIGALLVSVVSGPALAGDMRNGGKLFLTDGVSSLEGAGGGGLASWALIGGHETDAGVGAGAHASVAVLDDFTMTSIGAKVGLFDRVEFSYARQRFDTRAAGAALGLGKNYMLGQHVLGGKVRLFGDAVYDQDRIIPQVAIGVSHKIADKPGLIAALGGKSRSGTEFYAAATKVLLAQSLVVNVTGRLTNANQMGLLGFGGDRRARRSLQGEASLGWLASRRLLIGAEYRTKPDNLGFAKEGDAWDLFAAYSVTRNLSVTAAFVDMGSIATFRRQRGAYFSLQAGF